MNKINLFLLFLLSSALTYGCLLVGGKDLVGAIPGIWFCIASVFLAIASLGLFMAFISKIISDSFPQFKNQKIISSPLFLIIIPLLLILVLWGDYKSFIKYGMPFLPSFPLFIVKWCPFSLKFILLGLWAFDLTKKRTEVGENKSGFTLMISVLIIWLLCVSRTPSISIFWKFLFPIYMILNILYLKFKK